MSILTLHLHYHSPNSGIPSLSSPPTPISYTGVRALPSETSVLIMPLFCSKIVTCRVKFKCEPADQGSSWLLPSPVSRPMESFSSPYTSHLVPPLGFTLPNVLLYMIAFLDPTHPSRSMSRPRLQEHFSDPPLRI